MKVIFLQNIKGTAQIGDVKDVSDGYARNFLLPRRMAKIASPDAVKEAEAARRKWSMLMEVEKKRAQEILKDAGEAVVVITRKASSKGTLFDGIEKRDIAEKLREIFPIRIEEDMIKLEEPIKHIGNHTVEIEPAEGVRGQINVKVEAAEEK